MPPKCDVNNIIKLYSYSVLAIVQKRPNENGWTEEFIDAKHEQLEKQQKELAKKLEIEMGFFKAYLNDQLRLAKSCKCAPVAVQAVLQYLRYKKRSADKGKPIEFNNIILKALGYSHQAKLAALRRLEAAGFVRIEWRERKSPLATIVSEP